MNEYNDLKRKLSELWDMVGIKIGQVDSLRSEFPDLPEDYFTFMGTIGWGDFGAESLYSGPVPADEFWPQASGMEHVLLIGDYGLSYSFGFDTRNGHQFVKVDAEKGVRPAKESLLEIVRTSLG